MPARRIPLLLFGAFFALYFIWGSTYLAIRFGVESWPPMLMAGVRFVIAGGLMFAWLRWRGAPLPTWREWRGAGIVGILLLSCGNGGVTVAEHWGVSSGVAALAVATVPLFTLLFSQLFGQRNTTLEWGGIVPGPLGIVLLHLGSNLQARPAGAAEMLVGGAVLLVGSLASGERLEHWPSTSGWLALVYLILFGSIIAFSAYQYLLRNVRPAAATSYAYVNPAVAVLLGTLFAGERIGGIEGLAMLVIISAVVLIGLPQWRASRAAA